MIGYLMLKIWMVAFVLMVELIFAGESNSIIQSNSDGETINIEVVALDGGVLLQATQFLQDGSSTPPYTISSPERDVVTLPLLSMNNTGDSVVIWQSLNGETNSICIEAATYSQNLGWSKPTIVTNDLDNLEAGNYRLHLNDNGQFIIFWSIISPDGKNITPKNTIIKISDLFD